MYTDVSTTFPKKMFQPCIVILVSKVLKKWSVLSTRRIKKHPPLNPQSHPRNASNSLSTDHVRQRNPLGGEECVDRLCGSVVVNKKNKTKESTRIPCISTQSQKWACNSFWAMFQTIENAATCNSVDTHPATLHEHSLARWRQNDRKAHPFWKCIGRFRTLWSACNTWLAVCLWHSTRQTLPTTQWSFLSCLSLLVPSRTRLVPRCCVWFRRHTCSSTKYPVWLWNQEGQWRFFSIAVDSKQNKNSHISRWKVKRNRKVVPNIDCHIEEDTDQNPGPPKKISLLPLNPVFWWRTSTRPLFSFWPRPIWF